MKTLLSLLCAISLSVVSPTAHADTLTFNGVPGGGDIGPYSLTDTSGSVTTGLLGFCMNDQNYIQATESWSVNVINGANLTGPLATLYMQEAYIYSHFVGSNATDIQMALWKIFDPSESLSGFAAAQTMATNAANMSDAFYTNGSLKNFTFYLYSGGAIHNQVGDYTPQNFISTTAPTPEPSSLLFVGTGILAIAGIGRRRFLQASSV